MNGWGFAVIALAVGLVGAVVIVHRCDTQSITAVIGFAGGIVAGTFGLMTASRNRRVRELPPRADAAPAAPAADLERPHDT